MDLRVSTPITFARRFFSFLRNRILRNYWYKDSDITFLIQVYKDFDLATCALTRLRKYFPKSRLVIISDGDPDPRYKIFIEKFGAEFYMQERLYTIEHGGMLPHRWLEYFFILPTKYLIRVDTDTRFDRRFHYLPIATGIDVFGRSEGPKRLQGGCIVFSYVAAKKLLDTKIFLSQSLKDPNVWGEKLEKNILEEKIQAGEIATDWVLKWAFLQENINVYCFNEIYSTWKISIPNDKKTFAVVHPDKNMCKLKD